MLIVFAVAICTSAFLLFLVQPMIAKMILPQLGGTAAVWNTCMVFFQALLLAGYSYAHVLTGQFQVRRQVVAHLLVLLLPLAVLPVDLAFEWSSSQASAPIMWLLWLLLLSIGLPFFALSTTAPLLQKWFSQIPHTLSSDPYVLYAASNFGSMVALLGYPTIIEPSLSLHEGGWLSQSQLWSAGYGVLIVLIGTAGWGVWRAGSLTADSDASRMTAISRVSHRPDFYRLIRWVLWAFVPSSLMLGATSYVTTNIAAIPLLWIIPLVLYLLSFILAFARWPLQFQGTMSHAMPVLLVVLVFSIVDEGFTIPFGGRILLHLVTLFVVAMVCHGQLARQRPATEHLTAFYLAMSVGGVLGGIFNALIAPVVFASTAEYAIALVVAGLILPKQTRWMPQASTTDPTAVGGSVAGGFVRDGAWVLGIGAWIGGFIWLMHGLEKGAAGPTTSTGLMATLVPLVGLNSTQWLNVLLYGGPLILCYLLRSRSLVFGIGLGALLLVAEMPSASSHNILLHQERTFFGVLRIKFDRELNTHRLVHGTTIHGAQWLDPEKRGEPMTYYHRKGPIGDLLSTLQISNNSHFAVTGLGAGTLAAYAQAGQSLTFYEIDPAVVTVALDPRYFTYCADAKRRGVDLQMVVGDGRLNMVHAQDGYYDLVILDAFSADSLPVHLLTREAFELYLRKMTSNGVIAINASNRYLDIAPVLGNLTDKLHLVGLHRHDHEDEDVVLGKYPSHWIVVAKQRAALGALVQDQRWELIPRNPTLGVWTDNFSNVFNVFDWRS
jgi:hypothetical protein